MQLFLDFDGPILDNRAKYYALHVGLLGATSARPLSINQYWSCKQHRVPEREILARTGLTGNLVDAYLDARQRLIEHVDFLRLDRMWPGVAAWLAKARRRFELYLVTLRKRRDDLMAQLQWLGIRDHFRAILSEDANDGSHHVKTRLIQTVIDAEQPAWLIGDTEADIAAGRQCHLQTIGLTCGIRTPGLLNNAGADFIYARLADIAPDLLSATPNKHSSQAPLARTHKSPSDST